MDWKESSRMNGSQSVIDFDKCVSGMSIAELEELSSIELKNIIVECNLGNLLVSKEYGGQGLTLKNTLEAIHHISKRSPSIGIMLCMHYHVVSAISSFPQLLGFSEMLLNGVGRERRLVSSAISEGVPGLDVFSSTVRVSRTEGDEFVTVTGSKKPCTMSNVADYYAVSVVDDVGEIGLILIDSKSEGVSRKPFWPSKLLAGTDSNEVVFGGVHVRRNWLLNSERDLVLQVLSVGMASFNLMISAAYAGVASALGNKLPNDAKAKRNVQVEVFGRLMQLYYSVIGLAATLDDADDLGASVNNVLLLRYRHQLLIKEVVLNVNENIGSFKYLTDPEVPMLSGITNLMSFHPLNRTGFENS